MVENFVEHNLFALGPVIMSGNTTWRFCQAQFTQPFGLHRVGSNPRTECRRAHSAFQVAQVAEPQMQRRRRRSIAGILGHDIPCSFKNSVLSRPVGSAASMKVHGLTQTGSTVGLCLITLRAVFNGRSLYHTAANRAEVSRIPDFSQWRG